AGLDTVASSDNRLEAIVMAGDEAFPSPATSTACSRRMMWRQSVADVSEQSSCCDGVKVEDGILSDESRAVSSSIIIPASSSSSSLHDRRLALNGSCSTCSRVSSAAVANGRLLAGLVMAVDR
ncbi:hypothetical protein PFISCL1PPCAC_17489, partial [Pristionchus fissidentatus]